MAWRCHFIQEGNKVRVNTTYMAPNPRDGMKKGIRFLGCVTIEN